MEYSERFASALGRKSETTKESVLALHRLASELAAR